MYAGGYIGGYRFGLRDHSIKSSLTFVGCYGRLHELDSSHRFNNSQALGSQKKSASRGVRHEEP